MTTDGVQTWVSQLTALTSHKAVAHQDGKETGSVSKKPPQGITRKRPGTGRRLPSIPTDRTSPVSSEHSSYLGDPQPDLHIPDCNSPARPTSSRTSDIIVNGKTPSVHSPSSSLTKVTRISSQTGRTRNDSYTVETPITSSPNGVGSPCSTSRSRGSVDTELLLQDTETVMAAMEARIGQNNRGRTSAHNRTFTPDSDTDMSSTVGMVNGDDDYVKPTIYKSPRDALSKRSVNSKDASKNVSSTTPVFSASSKKNLGRSYSQTIASKSKTSASPRSATTVATRKSVVSDVFSSNNFGDNDSVISDVGSDVGEGNLSRSGSRGKGNITMTKPNRAFQLRRSRAESVEEPTTPRSAKSTGRSSAGGSSVRSASVHSTTRRSNLSNLDTNRSEATSVSLGGQIVRKSRQNAGGPAPEKAKSSTNLARADGGRHSLRLSRATSLTISQPTAASSAKRDSTPARSQSKSTVGSNSRVTNNLAVTGVSSTSLSSRSQPQSQPSSRSNSPKAAERMAWKRRKEYDPRRAVAEAKAKVKDGNSSAASSTASSITTRPKPSAASNYKRRMIRSASFTNSAELQLSAQNALSASQDFAAGAGHVSHNSHDNFRRGFVPFQPLRTDRTDRSAYSADEDDSMVSATSTQVCSSSLDLIHVTCCLTSQGLHCSLSWTNHIYDTQHL